MNVQKGEKNMEGYRNYGFFAKEDDFVKFEELANKINMSPSILLEMFINDLIEIDGDKYQTDGIKGAREFYMYWKYISTGQGYDE